MTNELRSVIEDARCRLIATQQKQETDYVHIVDVHHHVKETSLELLDAIIEYVQEDVEHLRNIPIKEDFDRGMIGAIEVQITKLKQAREELSTSLTQ